MAYGKVSQAVNPIEIIETQYEILKSDVERKFIEIYLGINRIIPETKRIDTSLITKDAFKYFSAPTLSFIPSLTETKLIMAVVIPRSVKEEIITIKLAAAENTPNSDTVSFCVRMYINMKPKSAEKLLPIKSIKVSREVSENSALMALLIYSISQV